MAEKRTMLTIVAADGQLFEIPKDLAVNGSEVIKQMLEEMDDSDRVPIEKVDGNIMSKIVEFWKLMSDKEKSEEDLKVSTATFLGSMKYSMIIEIMIAANFMNAKSLLEASVGFFAKRIANKTPDEIREELGIQTPFLEGEIEEAMQTNKWVFLKRDGEDGPSGSAAAGRSGVSGAGGS
ncbi:unnamed protein product [Pedinophyceae sp. YPF-701]|nr:unnamed protein product [Pedinophyceae sp. YPF-701]